MPTNTGPGRARLAAALDGDAPGNWADAMDADALDTARPEAREFIHWAPLDLLLAYREIDELIAALEAGLSFSLDGTPDDDVSPAELRFRQLATAALSRAKE
jgi:hypothetical protein